MPDKQWTCPSDSTCGLNGSCVGSSKSAFLPVEHGTPLPAAWTVEDNNGACFVCEGSKRQRAGVRLFRAGVGRRAAANLMTKDEARRIAANIAKLPTLLVRPQY